MTLFCIHRDMYTLPSARVSLWLGGGDRICVRDACEMHEIEC
jgi:hypothetical protein